MLTSVVAVTLKKCITSPALTCLHILSVNNVLAGSFALSFIVAGIALVRIYARLFLGPHIKATQETPLKSS